METIEEKLAWIHRDSNKLKARDLVELKFGLKLLIARSSECLDAVRDELESGRRKRLDY